MGSERGRVLWVQIVVMEPVKCRQIWDILKLMGLTDWIWSKWGGEKSMMTFKVSGNND